MQVAVCNRTGHDIALKSRTSLEGLQAVKSVTAADVRLSECRAQCDHQHLEKHEPQESTESTPHEQQDKGGENPLPAVDLNGLGYDQRIEAETMLRKEYESFSSNDEDIGCILRIASQCRRSTHQSPDHCTQG